MDVTAKPAARGPVQQKWYQAGFGTGYQEAMREIAEAFESRGEAGAREWVQNNLRAH